MKIIKLLLLLTFGLWADFKLDVPNDVNISQLENIVNNGWDDSNLTLNKWIVSNVERAMPEILEKIKKPVLKGKVTKNIIDPMPKIFLYKDDYYLIFSYVKYLEYEGKINKALNIYVEALQGLNSIKDKTMLSMVFRMVIENVIIKSFDSKNYTEKEKKYFKNKLKTALIKDTQILWNAIEKDRLGIVKELQSGLLTKILNSQNINLNKKIIVRFDKMKSDYNKEFYTLNTKENLIKFDKSFRKKSDEIISKYFEWEKNKKCANSEKIVVELVSDYIFIIGNPKLVNIKLDLWNSIKRNEIFLRQLK